MTKEEMQARGYVPEEVKRQQHRRAQWHDYNQKGIFMITLVTAGRRPLFGHLEGTSKAPRGSYDAPRLVLSPLGKSILEEEIPKITKHYPMVKVWRVAMMPDHLHLLLRVEEPLPKEKHLGFVLGGFKTGCSRAWWRLMDQERGLPACPSTTAPASPSSALPSATAPVSPFSTLPSTSAPVFPVSPSVPAPSPSAPVAPSLPSGNPSGTTATTPASSSALPSSTAPVSPVSPSMPAPSSTAPVSLVSPSMPAPSPSAPVGAVVPEGFPEGRKAAEGRPTPEGRAAAGALYPAHWVSYPLLFESGYHDRIIKREGMLDNIRRYMDENPLRAIIRRECPTVMQRRLHLWIHNREYAAFGNLFLLKNPDKEQVFFHRKNAQGTPTHLTPEYAAEQARLLRSAEEGAVLVTPGISKGEQGVVAAALAARLPLILLQKEPITEFWKPPQGRFYACAEGRLLILAPWSLDASSDYGRFHALNDLARDICQTTEARILNYSSLLQNTP